jgi:HK97 family phage major capsid protein
MTVETPESVLEQMDALVATEEGFNKDEYNALQMKLAFTKAAKEVADLKKPARNDFGIYVSGSDETVVDQERSEAFSRYLRTGDKAIAAEFAQSVGTTTAGGFTAPDEFRDKLVDRLVSFGGVASVAETITTENGNTVKWVTLDDTANEGEIAAEGSAGTSGNDLVFGEKELGSFKYVAPGADNSGADPLRVSVELLQDSAFDIESLISNKLGQRIARKQAVDFATGVGTTEPLGITSKTASVTFSTGEPTYDDLIDIIHDLDPAYLTNASWVLNNQTLGIIRKLKDTANRPLWQANAEAGLGRLPGGLLLGFPVVIDYGMPSLQYSDLATPVPGNQKAIVFGDIAESYVVRRVRDVQLIVDPYTRAAQGQVCYTVWARADGTVQNDWSFVVAQG